MNKKLFRCTVCQDIHYGIAGPELCPACQNKNTYKEIDIEEAKKIIGV